MPPKVPEPSTVKLLNRRLPPTDVVIDDKVDMSDAAAETRDAELFVI